MLHFVDRLYSRVQFWFVSMVPLFVYLQLFLFWRNLVLFLFEKPDCVL